MIALGLGWPGPAGAADADHLGRRVGPENRRRSTPRCETGTYPDAGGSSVGARRLLRYLPPGDKHSDVSDLDRGRGLNVSLHA